MDKTSKYKAENSALRLRLRDAEILIKSLKTELISNKRDTALYLRGVVQEEIYNYNLFLNPYPIRVACSIKNKSAVYEIKPTEIICVIAKGRTKYVYLIAKKENISGPLSKSQIIPINRNALTLEKLRQELDSLYFHLVQVSKSTIVNVSLFRRVNGYLYFTEENPIPDYKKLSVSKTYIPGFDKIKDNYTSIFSLQKRYLHYKVKCEREDCPNFVEPNTKQNENKKKRKP